MKGKILLAGLFLITTFLHAQTPDTDSISYTVDTIASPSCFGSSDGAILLDDVRIPGTIDRFEWNNGTDMEDLIFVNGGEYQLTVYNTDGESFQTEKFIVPEPDTLIINHFISGPTNIANSDGFIDLTITGGTAPFELTLRFNQDTTTIKIDSQYTLTDIDTGFYSFTVVDARGCIDSLSLEAVVQPCQILVTGLYEPSECDESPSGRIELFIENAIEPYNIEWSTGDRDKEILNNLKEGTYSLLITDRRKCQIRDSIDIITEDRIPPEVVVNKNVLLYLDQNGTATLEKRMVLIGARDNCNNDLKFEFDKSVFTCEDVGVNDINFYASDGVGNTTTRAIQVEVRDTQSIAFIYQDTVYTALCNGIAQYTRPKVRGSCSTQTTGGIVLETNREITSPGTYLDRYYYVIKPGDTIKADVTVIVTNKQVRAFLIVEEPKCNRGDDGSIAVSLRNFEFPVKYSWQDGSDRDFLFGIHNNQEYTVTVQEGNGCEFELSAYIQGPDSIKVSLQEIITKPESVTIIPEVSGGHPPLNYEWSQNGRIVSDSKNLLNVEDGKRYTLRVFDAKNCFSRPLIVDRTATPTIAELESNILIYPNPTSEGWLNVRFSDHPQSYEKVQLLTDRLQILSEQVQLSGEMSIPIDGLPPGMYYLQFFRKDGLMFSKKFIRL